MRKIKINQFNGRWFTKPTHLFTPYKARLLFTFYFKFDRFSSSAGINLVSCISWLIGILAVNQSYIRFNWRYFGRFNSVFLFLFFRLSFFFKKDQTIFMLVALCWWTVIMGPFLWIALFDAIYDNENYAIRINSYYALTSKLCCCANHRYWSFHCILFYFVKFPPSIYCDLLRNRHHVLQIHKNWRGKPPPLLTKWLGNICNTRIEWHFYVCTGAYRKRSNGLRLDALDAILRRMHSLNIPPATSTEYILTKAFSIFGRQFICAILKLYPKKLPTQEQLSNEILQKKT